MQLLPILLVAAVMAVDGGVRPLGSHWNLSHGLVAIMTCGTMALIVLIAWLGMIWCDHTMRLGRFPRPLIAAERFGRWARLAILLSHLFAVLVLDWLGALRSVTGDLILIDEVFAIAPTICGWIGVWWAYYPIDKRLHQATLIRQLDEGHAIYPSLTRRAYTLLQVRMHLLLLLVPVLAIAGLTELIGRVDEANMLPQESEWIIGVGKIAAGAGVFMLAPLLARVMLDVRPVPMGELRDMLVEVCRRHQVRVRELLIWNTNGSMFNAAVMGIIGPLRYVLLTDALLESMPQDQVRAVMAHEIGHVRRRHMVWMIGALLACFSVAMYVFRLPFYLEWIPMQALTESVQIALAVGELTVALALFGWVSRRFERQADTFAVQHLSQQMLGNASHAVVRNEQQMPLIQQAIESNAVTAEHRVVTPRAVHAMCGALNFIARLNAIELHRRSWRHGSIAWRMEYLRSIIGKPVDVLAIDRTVRRIKLAAALILIGSCAHLLVEYMQIQEALRSIST